MLREELASHGKATVPSSWLDDVPATVHAYVSDLRKLLDAGQVERVKAGLAALVKQIEVQEVPRPGARRPGARLVFRGNLAGAVALANGKVKTDGSPGGSLPVRNSSLPQAEKVTRLPKRMSRGRKVAVASGTGGRE
jgi:hypothetical protein